MDATSSSSFDDAAAEEFYKTILHSFLANPHDGESREVLVHHVLRTKVAAKFQDPEKWCFVYHARGGTGSSACCAAALLTAHSVIIVLFTFAEQIDHVSNDFTDSFFVRYFAVLLPGKSQTTTLYLPPE